MRYLALLCLTLLTCCTQPPLTGGEDNTTILATGSYRPLNMESTQSEFAFHAEDYPPQCNPASWFPDGKVPDDFLTHYYKPQRERFDACVFTDRKAHAKGKEILFYMPESRLKTLCSAGAQYTDGKVRPGFYGYPSPPEFDRYVECLIAEAHRDGDRVRLASPLSFPRVGTCYDARVAEVSSGDGIWGRHTGSTAISFDNGLSLFSYENVPAAEHLQPGDRVQQCVRDLPKGCPSHDLRGIDYRIINLQTGERFTMPDSQHMCRGA